MLAETVALFDVRDVESFVQATINASGRTYTQDMRDELCAEGFRIMLDLAAKFEPHRAGYEHEGRFSGFAAKYLRLKLEDAYHRLCPEHTLRADPETGRRVWHYGERAVSLEAMTAEDPDRHALMAAPETSEQVEGWLRQALQEDADRTVEMTLLVARARGRAAARGERLTDEQIAERTGLSVDQVRDRNRRIDGMRDRPAGVTLEQALRKRNADQVELATGVGCLLSQGCTPADVSEMLRVDPGIVRDCMLLIARVRTSLETFMNERRAA